ncbi:Oidioi.mRNA.OKI2018_I69.PAR.g9219.t1.cds [Oikopleura dioica]|uniref:Oidioi.mRNA.OKI2018_I69.PAR.g9219.t1.cds n=1 Tax=Oikopleura dioica TaxID=34765 RepID=A0ABN7RJM9_OIKDI|nr:Oidioi.mRNA.OKI2018_I69.PAR.g9219.t1.cds [Oikopleura dioica]
MLHPECTAAYDCLGWIILLFVVVLAILMIIGYCQSGFAYRWYDILNEMLFNSGETSRIEVEKIPEEFQIHVIQQEPMRMILENEFVVHKRLEFETTASTTITTKNTPPPTAGPPSKLLIEPIFPQMDYPETCGWLKESTMKKSMCSISSLSSCNTPLFADVLSLTSSTESCPVNHSATILERIFEYAQKLASNSGFFKGQCATTKKQLPCDLMMINLDREDQLKPSSFIRKMRMITRKIVADCEISHRHELQELYREVWSSIKSCGPNQNTKSDDLSLLIGERGLAFQKPRKEFCRISGYASRNMKWFSSRLGLVKDQERAVELFEELAEEIADIGAKAAHNVGERCLLDGDVADRIPCELAFIPKNEEGCQLGARLARVVKYLQQKCPLLVSQAVPRKLRKLEEALAREEGTCPELGTKMTRDIRLVAMNTL